MRTLARWWNKFWFEKRDPLPVAIYRVLIGLCILQANLTQALPHFAYFYGKHAICSVDVVSTYYWYTPEIFDPLVAFHSNTVWQTLLFALLLTANVTMIFGLFTRLSTVVLYLGLFALYNHDVFVNNGGDEFRRLMVLFLCFAPAAETFSLDSIFANFKKDWRVHGFAPALQPVWSLRWMQLQLSYIYWNVFLNKTIGPEWQDGTAVYYSSHVENLQRFKLPYIFENDLTVRLLTYGTMFVEASLAVVVWIKPLRYLILLVGLIFHAGIDLTMDLPAFETAFVSTYILFVSAEDLYKFAAWLRGQIRFLSGAPVICYYEGNRVESVRWAGVIRRLDILRTLEIKDCKDLKPDLATDFRQLLMVQEPRSHVLLSGFAAFSVLCSQLPLLWPLVPLNMLLHLCRCGPQVFATVSNALIFFAVKPKNQLLSRSLEVLSDPVVRQRCFLLFVAALFVSGIVVTQIERPAMVKDVKSRAPRLWSRKEQSRVKKHLGSLKDTAESDPEKMHWLCRAAYLARMQSEFTKAENLYLLVLKQMKADDPVYQALYVKTLLQLADNYLDAGSGPSAVKAYLNVQKFDQKWFAKDTNRAIRDFNNLAVAHYYCGLGNLAEESRQAEFKIADSYMSKALALDVKPEQKANLCDNLALIRRDRGSTQDYSVLKEQSKLLTKDIQNRLVPP